MEIAGRDGYARTSLTLASMDHRSTALLIAVNIESRNVTILKSSYAFLMRRACSSSSASSNADIESTIRVRPFTTPDKVCICKIAILQASSGIYVVEQSACWINEITMGFVHVPNHAKLL